MNIYEKLQTEIQEIKKDFVKVLEYSQKIDGINVDEIFDIWYKNKLFYIESFGLNLVYEYPEPIEFTLDEQDYDELYVNCVAEVSDISTSIGKYMTKNSSANTFINNRTLLGEKLGKSFKKVEEQEDKRRKCQDIVSKYVQLNKMEGILCFSVHPLDFLSLSDNAENWTSCHSLSHTRRSGNLSYMLDESTIVCYLKSKDNKKIVNFPPDVLWNSKKWRMLLFYSTDRKCMFAGRQYPTSYSNALNVITPIFDKVNNTYEDWKPWKNVYINSINMEDYNETMELEYSYVPLSKKLYTMNSLIQDESDLHYNDLKYSHIYTQPWYREIRDLSFVNFQFKIGYCPKCIKCGEKVICDSETFMCQDCEIKYGKGTKNRFIDCPRCGKHFDSWTENSYLIDKKEYCEKCGKELERKYG